jgi:hypothetical protein
MRHFDELFESRDHISHKVLAQRLSGMGIGFGRRLDGE